MSLVIEEINRSKKVIQRFKFDERQEIRIGRALDNDVILNEPHVSPHHLILRQTDAGTWVAEDLNSVNGIRNSKRKLIPSGCQVKSGDTLLLGRSYLTIYDEQHPVEEAWSLHSIEDVFHYLSHPLVVFGLLVTFIFLEWQLTQAQEYRELSPSRLMNQLMYQLVVIFGWSSLWSLNGRILRHDSRFLSHLAVSLVAAMAYQWLPWLLRLLTYNWHLGLWYIEIGYFINGIIFSSMLWCNFYLALPQRPLSRILWVNGLTWSLVMIYLLPPMFDDQGFRSYPRYDSSLLPYSVQFVDSKSTNDFVKDTEVLFKRPKEQQNKQ